MCGIAGIISQDSNFITRERLKAMTDAIAHRGPDGEGQWVSENGQVGLGHRRLSILDLSEVAGQPMHYAERYSIVFNGEIYNYLEIKNRLLQKGFQFRTTSDTEVLMALYHEQKEACLQELDGMFAFVIYDKEEQTVFCARDRFGEKPFFYALPDKNRFYFASEMKALWAGGIPKENNENMLANYLAFSSLENPENKKETFFRNIYRLPAATYLKINLDTFAISEKQYWDLNYRNINDAITFEEAQQKFRDLFFTSVSRRLRSDVPVGSSLSGGLDSSLVVSIIDAIDSQKKITRNTFSAQFPGFIKDESRYQQMVIDRTHVNPYFVQPTADSMLANLDKIAYHQEEPFGSASIAVQYEVFKLAKENDTTVLLDGQGADEILAGYHSYFYDFFKELKSTDRNLHSTQWNAYAALHEQNAINPLLKTSWKSTLREKMPDGLVKQLRSLLLNFTPDSAEVNFEKEFTKGRNVNRFSFPEGYGSLNHALYQSTRVYGLEQLLRYADRNSMAHSREVRLPFLSHELVEFIFTLPATFKINNGWTKYLMRAAYDDVLPKEITWRVDKVGYEPPQQQWLKSGKLNEKLVHAVEKLASRNMLGKKAADSLKDKELNQLEQSKAWKLIMSGYLLD